jgi:ribosomal protein S18 acetylase RimI-like enzyme
VDEAERIAVGFVEAERTRRSRVAGAEVAEVDGLALAFANVPDPSVNFALVLREPADPRAALVRAEELFAERGRSFGINLHVGRHLAVEDAVRAAGLERLFGRPGMAIAIDRLAETSVTDGIEIRPVTDEREGRALARVDGEAFEDPSGVAEDFYAAAALAVDGGRSFIAWEGGEPVGIAAGYVHDGAVGIFGVGVVARARRRGIGAALTLHAARAFPGADLAWLHPSDMARSMYERLGFRTVSDWEVWVRPRIAAVPGADPAPRRT